MLETSLGTVPGLRTATAAAAEAFSCSWEYGMVDMSGALIPKVHLEGESQATASKRISRGILGLWTLLWPLVSYFWRTEMLPEEGTAAWHGGQWPYLTPNICVSQLQAWVMISLRKVGHVRKGGSEEGRKEGKRKTKEHISTLSSSPTLLLLGLCLSLFSVTTLNNMGFSKLLFKKK